MTRPNSAPNSVHSVPPSVQGGEKKSKGKHRGLDHFRMTSSDTRPPQVSESQRSHGTLDRQM